MSVDMQSAIQKALAKAQAKAKAQVEREVKADEASRASKVEAWKKQISDREAAERQARNKSAMDIAEAFLHEIAAPFHRLCTRDDAKKLEPLTITLRPGKSGNSAGHSIEIHCPGSGMTTRVWHRANIEQMGNTLNAQVERLRAKGGFHHTTQVDLMEEVIKLREMLMKVDALAKADVAAKNANVDPATADPTDPAHPSNGATAKIHDIIGTLHLPEA